jgi:hypothetical protein
VLSDSNVCLTVAGLSSVLQILPQPVIVHVNVTGSQFRLELVGVSRRESDCLLVIALVSESRILESGCRGGCRGGCREAG